MNNQTSLYIQLFSIFLIGACLGVLAQLIRQLPDPLTTLGASTGPWLMSGFFLAAIVSKKYKKNWKAMILGTGAIYIYLISWLFFYHLLFVLQENLPIGAGWREAAPWLVATVLVSPILGVTAAMLHRPGILGDICLAAPISWSLPVAIGDLGQNWLSDLAVVIPVTILIVLLIRMVITERCVHVFTLLMTAIVLSSLAVFLYPIFRSQILS